jgi:hypothetical protein
VSSQRNQFFSAHGKFSAPENAIFIVNRHPLGRVFNNFVDNLVEKFRSPLAKRGGFNRLMQIAQDWGKPTELFPSHIESGTGRNVIG